MKTFVCFKNHKGWIKVLRMFVEIRKITGGV